MIKGHVKNKKEFLIGEYEIVQNNLFYRDYRNYDFDMCSNITNLRYWDSTESKSMLIKECFRSEGVFICEKQYIVIVKRNDDFYGYKYSCEVNSDDLSMVVLSIKLFGG